MNRNFLFVLIASGFILISMLGNIVQNIQEVQTPTQTQDFQPFNEESDDDEGDDHGGDDDDYHDEEGDDD